MGSGALVLAGCGSAEEEEFQYGETDMRNVAVGEFTGEMTLSGKPATSFDLVITQPPPSSQPLCGNRTFTAILCVDISTINLDGTLTSADGTFASAKLDGSFLVTGLTMSNGELDLQGAGVTFYIGWTPEGFAQGTVGGSQQGTFTLQKKPAN